jgi:hypothetical protein
MFMHESVALHSMATLILPHTFYQQQIENINRQLQALHARRRQLAWARLGAALFSLAVPFFFWDAYSALTLLAALPALAVFIWLIKKDINNKHAIEHQECLQEVNQDELKMAAGQYTHRPDGIKWQPEKHVYAGDLDLFGRASLFQYINRGCSEQGQHQLAQWLLHRADTPVIKQRQTAVQELAGMPHWRQELQAKGAATPVTQAAEEKINQWLQTPHQFLHHKSWQVLRWLLPATSFGILSLYIFSVIDFNRFMPMILLCTAVSFFISKKATPLYRRLESIAPQTESLASVIACIESAPFKNALLQQWQQTLQTNNQVSSQRIHQLKEILNRFDYRLNPLVFVPLNTFLFWDLQQALALEKWKESESQKTTGWFGILARFEASVSLATLAFNHPAWVFPHIHPHGFICSGTGLGHPLIPENKRVANDFEAGEGSRLNLVTGSNMAGKSTFLRTMGMNIVLALAGAPVCAQSFTYAPVNLMSSMRIGDNLEENTSTFYAELKKLKEIIEAVNRQEPVFLLLDEILRGTNSQDRHNGSRALIDQLLRHRAAGLIATHDLELAGTKGLPDYHFDVQVAGEELYFDYQLKKGVCTSMNASLLMKKIGIEMEG